MEISVVGLIRLAQDKGEVTFYWDSKTPYESSSKSRFASLEGGDIEFKRDTDALARVIGINIPSDRLNISFRVQVPGTATNKTTGVSKKCSYFADRTVIRDGELAVQVLSAQLSQRLFDVCLKAGALNNDVYDPDTIYSIDASKFNIVSSSDLHTFSQDELAKSLLSIKNLKVRQWAIGKKKKDYIPQLDQVSDVSVEDSLFVNSSGIFNPPYQPSAEEKLLDKMVQTRFVEWDVAKYPEKVRKEEASNDVAKSLSGIVDVDDIISVLDTDLKSTKAAIRTQESVVHWSRLVSNLLNVDVFAWDKVETKPKKSTHKSTGENLVVGGEMQKSMAEISGITVVENRWTELV